MRERRSGFANPWLILGFEIVCVLVYELLQKRGASETASLSQVWSWTGITALASPLTWLAMLIMIISLLSWLYVLRPDLPRGWDNSTQVHPQPPARRA